MIRAERARDEQGREGIGVTFDGNPMQLLQELRQVITMYREQVTRSCSPNEEAYAYIIARTYAMLQGQAEACMTELKTIAEETENDRIRKDIKDLAKTMRKFQFATAKERDKMLAKTMEKLAEEMERKADGQDTEKIAELEEALRARMEGRDREE